MVNLGFPFECIFFYFSHGIECMKHNFHSLIYRLLFLYWCINGNFQNYKSVRKLMDYTLNNLLSNVAKRAKRDMFHNKQCLS